MHMTFKLRSVKQACVVLRTAANRIWCKLEFVINDFTVCVTMYSGVEYENITIYQPWMLNAGKPFRQYQPSWSWKRFILMSEPSIAPTTLGTPHWLSNAVATSAHSWLVCGKWMASRRCKSRTETTSLTYEWALVCEIPNTWPESVKPSVCVR